MNYKLAKELKEAGFPQKLIIGNEYYSKIGHPRMGIPIQWAETLVLSEGANNMSGEWYKKPTLSELIDACGEEFDSLSKYLHKWVANASIDPLEIDSVSVVMYGKTPEESVAKLWLELNKK